MTDIIQQLKSGKCLCLKCKQVNPAGWEVQCESHGNGQRGFRPDYTECYHACEYDNGKRVGVITWEGIQYGEPTPDGLSDQDMKWLEANYPEIIIEMDRVEFAYFTANQPMPSLEAAE